MATSTSDVLPIDRGNFDLLLLSRHELNNKMMEKNETSSTLFNLSMAIKFKYQIMMIYSKNAAIN
jgi:hypothetical protein